MPDELGKAITKIIYPLLRENGFSRHGKRNMVRHENGIVHRLYFQLFSYGDKTFCVTACANLIAGNEFSTLQPGFRIFHDRVGEWLPSSTPQDAENSAYLTLSAITGTVLPYFEEIRTLPGYTRLLARECWASEHHLKFQQGVTAALNGDPSGMQHLASAIELHETDGREWCGGYIKQARELLDALAAGQQAKLLNAWTQANKAAHGLT